MAITNDQKQKYTLLSGTHATGGVVYDARDSNRNVIELTKTQAENMGDRVRLEGAQEDSEQKAEIKDPNPNLSGGSAAPVNEIPNTRTNTVATGTTGAASNTTESNTNTASASSSTTSESDNNSKLTSLLAGNLSDVESEISKIDSTSDLDTLAKLEQSGKQRSGVMKMIRERKEELK